VDGLREEQPEYTPTAETKELLKGLGKLEIRQISSAESMRSLIRAILRAHQSRLEKGDRDSRSFLLEITYQIRLKVMAAFVGRIRLDLLEVLLEYQSRLSSN
jgi:hypothetical protein